LRGAFRMRASTSPTSLAGIRMVTVRSPYFDETRRRLRLCMESRLQNVNLELKRLWRCRAVQALQRAGTRKCVPAPHWQPRFWSQARLRWFSHNQPIPKQVGQFGSLTKNLFAHLGLVLLGLFYQYVANLPGPSKAICLQASRRTQRLCLDVYFPSRATCLKTLSGTARSL
jgi:hypothetical protein